MLLNNAILVHFWELTKSFVIHKAMLKNALLFRHPVYISISNLNYNIINDLSNKVLSEDSILKANKFRMLPVFQILMR